MWGLKADQQLLNEWNERGRELMRRGSQIVIGIISVNISPDPFLVSRKSSQQSTQTNPFSLCSRQEQGLLRYMSITADVTCMAHDGAETESVGIERYEGRCGQE